MINVQTAPNKKQEFQCYDELFDYIAEAENHKMLELKPNFRTIQWSFQAYAPHHVQALYTHLKDHHPAIREASENQLPLIEICTGDLTKLEYVVVTKNIKIQYLKKKWALAYCDAHGMTVATTD